MTKIWGQAPWSQFLKRDGRCQKLKVIGHEPLSFARVPSSTPSALPFHLLSFSPPPHPQHIHTHMDVHTHTHTNMNTHALMLFQLPSAGLVDSEAGLAASSICSCASLYTSTWPLLCLFPILFAATALSIFVSHHSDTAIRTQQAGNSLHLHAHTHAHAQACAHTFT